ncbi:MAG TPA: OmpA family protein [Bacteroidales bacterium]|nr:OmpA family protein [Bacteroidales bacterium]HRZ49151.1 OmpA family protein [Bacteroidales bacterium]
MKRIGIQYFAIIMVVLAGMVACVPARKFNDTKTALEKCLADQQAAMAERDRLQEQLKVSGEKNQGITREADALRRDTARLGSMLEQEVQKNAQLTQTNELLLQKNNEFLSENRLQTERITRELAETQEKLILKEDALKKMETDLNKQQTELQATAEQLKVREAALKTTEGDLGSSRAELERSLAELEASRRDLEQKQQKLLELQRVLAQKDSTVEAIRSTVSNALQGFAEKGLMVEERNGKVYVSMDNKLLFATGSTEVGAEGRKALAELAKVLQANPEINVLVEGHTDDVPLKGSVPMKDNWDLSVLRATEIIRILLSGSTINPTRLTAAGRSQYLPVDPAPTPEARARNRRTEIILTPKLDELFRVIESN